MENKRIEKRLYLASIITAAIIYLLHVIPIFSDNSNFWGTDQWRYMPRFIQIILLCIAVLSFIPSVTKLLHGKLYYFINAIIKRIKSLPVWSISAALIIISFAVFWILRQRTYFLGDGYLRLRGLGLGQRYVVFEPLDTFIHSVLYEYINKIIAINPAFVFNLVSIICGVLFLFLIYRFTNIFTTSKNLKFLALSSFLFMGTVQLFFGYVENYTILALMVTAFLYFGYRVINHNVPFYIPVFVSSFAICIHPTGIVLLPALLYLFILEWIKINDKRLRFLLILRSIASILLPLILLFTLFQLKAGISPIDFIRRYMGDIKRDIMIYYAITKI